MDTLPWQVLLAEAVDIAIRYGYYRYQTDIMLVTIVILVVLVQILQGIGMMLSRKLDKRKA